MGLTPLASRISLHTYCNIFSQRPEGNLSLKMSRGFKEDFHFQSDVQQKITQTEMTR